MLHRFAAVLVAGLLLPSCASERTLNVTSEPPGAIVRLDNEAVGTTPLVLPFHHYGIRRITLYKDGYRTHTRRLELETPWYSRFPLDLVTEVLLPFGWKDRRRYHAELELGEERMTVPSLRSVIDRANALRHAGPEGPRNLPSVEQVELPSVDESPEESEAKEGADESGPSGEEEGLGSGPER